MAFLLVIVFLDKPGLGFTKLLLDLSQPFFRDSILCFVIDLFINWENIKSQVYSSPFPMEGDFATTVFILFWNRIYAYEFTPPVLL